MKFNDPKIKPEESYSLLLFQIKWENNNDPDYMIGSWDDLSDFTSPGGGVSFDNELKAYTYEYLGYKLVGWCLLPDKFFDSF